jgi:hypothetical protein
MLRGDGATGATQGAVAAPDDSLRSTRLRCIRAFEGG